MRKIFITTAIDYTNDVVHVGHAYQKILADCLARYYRIACGKENVFFLTGTDEHGGNIEESAQKQRKNPKDFVDAIVAQDKKQWETLNISYDRFIRTTDEDHKKIVEEFWRKSLKEGDIYKGTFRGLYCLGCESYKSVSEIVDGKCPLHKTKTLQKTEEENYFFRWSKYQSFLEKFYQNNPNFIIPQSRQHEMESFLKQEVADIVISRSSDKISWGIPVPDDPSQTIYVWFDALINYYTAASKAGFWDDDTQIIHIIGKDNLRWHALLWPAMLQSVELRLPDTIYAHGFINLNGQKISKSLGNVIRPDELVKQFGADAVRFYLLYYGPSVDDADLSSNHLERIYKSLLADHWGNLVQRIAVLCEKSGFINHTKTPTTFSNYVDIHLKNLRVQHAVDDIMNRIAHFNHEINQKEPWNKTGKELETFLSEAVSNICQFAFDFVPFMPETSEKIIAQFIEIKIKAQKPYFPRLSR